MRNATLFALSFLLLASPIAAQQAPTQEKGFAPDKVFHLTDFDSINTFNGNLAIHIPIGPTYPVSSSLSYGLTLFYNSKVWDFEEQTDGSAYAWPNRHSNAGMGWLVSLGRLEPINSPANDIAGWVYEAPDGSERALVGQLHSGFPTGGTSSSATLYTTDSSYLRATIGISSETLEFPDGTIQTFNSSGRLASIADRFGNSVSITYFDVAPIPAPCSSTDTSQSYHRQPGFQDNVCMPLRSGRWPSDSL